MKLFAFAAAVASLLCMPGPSNTLLATSGAISGIKRSLILIACEVAGYAVSITILIAVGRSLFAMFPAAKGAMRVVLILFILFTAVRLWRSRYKELSLEGNGIAPGTVFFTTLLNPKALIFAFVIFPEIATAGDFFTYGGTFAAISMPVGLIWIALGTFAGTFLGANKTLISRLAALALVVFACVAASAI